MMVMLRERKGDFFLFFFFEHIIFMFKVLCKTKITFPTTNIFILIVHVVVCTKDSQCSIESVPLYLPDLEMEAIPHTRFSCLLQLFI